MRQFNIDLIRSNNFDLCVATDCLSRKLLQVHSAYTSFSYVIAPNVAPNVAPFNFRTCSKYNHVYRVAF